MKQTFMKTTKNHPLAKKNYFVRDRLKGLCGRVVNNKACVIWGRNWGEEVD